MSPKDRGRKSLAFFCKYYLAEDFPLEFGKFHYEIFDLIATRRRVALAAPTSFAKSTCISVGAALWLLLYFRLKVLLLSNTGTLSEEWLLKLRGNLESNALLLRDFGDLKTKMWRQDHLRLKDGGELYAKGAGYQIRGFRPHVIIGDDLEDDEGVRNEDRRRKLEEWFDSALTNRLDAQGQLILIGTVLHQQALLPSVMKRETWESRLYQAIQRDADGNEVSLWDSKWSLEDLYRRQKEIGSIAFAQDFMNDPWPDTKQVFSRDWFPWYDGNCLPEPREFFVALDPAISEQDDADYSAWVLGSLHRASGHVYVHDAGQDHWSVYETIEKLFSLQKQYGISRAGVEAVAYQKALKQVIQYEARKRGIHLSVLELRPDADKIRRARSVAHLCEQGRVHIRRGLDEMFGQLVEFPQSLHDDYADAFVYLLKTMQSVFQFGYPVKPPPEERPRRDPWHEVGLLVQRKPSFIGLWT